VVTGRVEEGTVRVGDQVLINSHRRARSMGSRRFARCSITPRPRQHRTTGPELDRSQVEQDDLVTAADEPSPATVVPPSGHDPRFAEVEEQRRQFLSMQTAGLMDERRPTGSFAGWRSAPVAANGG